MTDIACQLSFEAVDEFGDGPLRWIDRCRGNASGFRMRLVFGFEPRLVAHWSSWFLAGLFTRTGTLRVGCTVYTDDLGILAPDPISYLQGVVLSPLVVGATFRR
jgi:hypothetical protein